MNVQDAGQKIKEFVDADTAKVKARGEALKQWHETTRHQVQAWLEKAIEAANVRSHRSLYATGHTPQDAVEFMFGKAPAPLGMTETGPALLFSPNTAGSISLVRYPLHLSERGDREPLPHEIYKEIEVAALDEAKVYEIVAEFLEWAASPRSQGSPRLIGI